MLINVNKKCSSFVIMTFVLLKFSTVIQSGRLNLIDNGYEEVHVGVGFSIPEKSSDALINAIKSVINETSRALFIATNNRAYFRKVKIHVPPSWEAVTADEETSITGYNDIDFLVTSNKNSAGSETFTLQSGECGAPGDYILVTKDFFAHEKVSNKGKILVQEWAKYRWGVFDEHGYQDDPEYPLFYVDSKGEVQPNYCVNSRINGTIVYPDSNKTCINNPFTGLPSDSCKFMVDDKSRSPVSSSLMSASNIPSIEKFCDSSTHNSKLRNEHNDKCGGRSVWDVLDGHEDFLYNTNPPIFGAPDPQFRIAKLLQPSYCIVIDDSYAMKKAHRNERVKKAVANWVNYEVEKYSKIAIVSFSHEAETLHTLTTVIDDETKMSLVNSIDLKSTGEISCLLCGLQKAINILEGTTNSVIILLNTDIATAPISMEFMNMKEAHEIKVVSISLIDFESYTNDELIASTTDGQFIIADDDIGNVLDDALRRSVVVQDFASRTVKIISETQVIMLPSNKNSGNFIIDSTVRNNLRVVIQTNDPNAFSESEFLSGPSGELSGILISKVEKVVHFIVPYAEEGVWNWEIQYNSVKTDAMLSVEVFVDLVDPSVPPISARHWALTESNENSLDPKVYLYSEVMQGNNPVTDAIVNVKLTSVERGVTLEKTLLDEIMDGGIYSADIAEDEFPIFGRYLAQFTVESHSTTKIEKRSINKKVKKATPIAFKRSEYLVTPFLSDFKEKKRSLEIHQRFKRQVFTIPTIDLGIINITTTTDSTTTNTGTTSTNTESTTTNTGTTTTNTESTTTNTGTTTTNTESTTTNTESTTTNTGTTTTNTGTTNAETASTTTDATTKKGGGGGGPFAATTTTSAESTTTNTQPTTTNTASTTANPVSTTTNTETTTANTATTTTNAASTTPNTAVTTTTGVTGSTTIDTGSTTTGTGSTTTGTGSTTTGTDSATTGTGSTTTGTVSTTTGTGSTTTGTGSTTTATGSTSTGTGSTTTATGSTTTGTGSITTATGSTTTNTGSTTIGTGSTTTGSTTIGTGSTTTGTGSTTTGTGSTTTGTGSTTTGTGSTTTNTGTTTTGTGSTTVSTGSTTTGTGSTTTGTGSTTTGTGSTTTGTGSTTTGTGSTTTGTGSTTTGTGSTTTGTGSTTTGTGSTTTGTGSTTAGTGSTSTGSTTTGTGSTTTGIGSTTTGTGSTTTGTGSTTQSTLSSTTTPTLAPTTPLLTLIGLKTDSDSIAPAAVTNVLATAASENTVQIFWTATGDDGTTGKATAYQILLSTNQSDVQCQVPTNCSQNAIILSYVNSVSALAVIPTAGQPMNITYTSPTPLQSNVTYYASIIPLDDSGNFGAVSNVSPFVYVAPQPFDYQQYFVTTVWPVLYQILQYMFSALYDICFAVIVGSTAGVFALAGLAIYFGGLREGDLELGINSGKQFPDDIAGLMNFKTAPQYNQAPQYNKTPSKSSDDLSDIQGVKKIRGATPDDILFVWSPIQGFDFDGNILYDE